MSSTRRVSAVRLSVSALVCPTISAMRPLSAGSLRGVSIARSILSSRAVNSAATGAFCAAAGEGGGFGAGFDGAAGISDAAVPTGVVSRDGMTPANQSAAAAPAITAAPISALATCDVKRRADRGEAGAFAPAVACSAAPVPGSPAVALSAALSTSVAANSIVGGRRPALSPVSLVMPSLLKQLPRKYSVSRKVRARHPGSAAPRPEYAPRRPRAAARRLAPIGRNARRHRVRRPAPRLPAREDIAPSGRDRPRSDRPRIFFYAALRQDRRRVPRRPDKAAAPAAVNERRRGWPDRSHCRLPRRPRRNPCRALLLP